MRRMSSAPSKSSILSLVVRRIWVYHHTVPTQRAIVCTWTALMHDVVGPDSRFECLVRGMRQQRIPGDAAGSSQRDGPRCVGPCVARPWDYLGRGEGVNGLSGIKINGHLLTTLNVVSFFPSRPSSPPAQWTSCMMSSAGLPAWSPTRTLQMRRAFSRGTRACNGGLQVQR